MADPGAQPIGGYLGGGLVQEGTISGRPADGLGIAIARAIIGGPAVTALGLHQAKTSFELTYEVKASQRFVVQTDLITSTTPPVSRMLAKRRDRS